MARICKTCGSTVEVRRVNRVKQFIRCPQCRTTVVKNVVRKGG